MCLARPSYGPKGQGNSAQVRAKVRLSRGFHVALACDVNPLKSFARVDYDIPLRHPFSQPGFSPGKH
jgi:hypothetical protein